MAAYAELGWDPISPRLHIPAGVAVLIVATISLLSKAWSSPGEVVLFVVGLFTLGLSLYWWLRRYRERRWTAFWSNGPRELWPFIREADYRKAVQPAT